MITRTSAGAVVLACCLLSGAGAAAPDPAEKDSAAGKPPLPAGVTVEGDRILRTRDRAEILLVDSGSFRMGSTPAEIAAAKALARRFQVEVPAESLAAERPAHTIDLPAFYLDRYEVTNRQYGRFVTFTKHPPPSNSFHSGFDVWVKGAYPMPLADHPVVNVGWEDAAAYCEWAGARLPTEAEWEKAARGDDGRAFPWGNFWDEGRANRGTYKPEAGDWKGDAMDGHMNTAPVGSFPAGRSPWGADDMAGNVLEWVQDRFDPAYYASAPPASPPGPASGEERVLRSGSWYYDPVRARTTFRHHLAPDVRNAHTGFRCAQDVPTAPR